MVCSAAKKREGVRAWRAIPQFKNIMHRKGAQDARRAKQFTKIIRELTVAAREGLPDPDANPRLRTAVAAARTANMPRNTMERAIKRGAGEGGGDAFTSVRYEGYGPGGVAMMVETLTGNRNRTASAVRTAFTKYGGNLGETNRGFVPCSGRPARSTTRPALRAPTRCWRRPWKQAPRTASRRPAGMT